jgi:maleate cis-trans isomerase
MLGLFVAQSKAGEHSEESSVSGIAMAGRTDGQRAAAALKVGLMVPANNTTMEGELAAWLPAGSTVTTVKIPRGAGLLTKDTIPAYRDSAIALARQHFSGAGLDVLAYGCTAAGFISGPAGDAELAAMLSAATGLTVVTTARAMVNALQHDGAKRVAVVTPYHDAINAQLAAFLASGDISVVRMDTFRAPDVEALGRITAEQVRDLARATMGPDCDALFIGCSQLPTYAILAGLEAEFARPAWSSIRATAWDAARVPVETSPGLRRAQSGLHDEL